MMTVALGALRPVHDPDQCPEVAGCALDEGHKGQCAAVKLGSQAQGTCCWQCELRAHHDGPHFIGENAPAWREDPA